MAVKEKPKAKKQQEASAQVVDRAKLLEALGKVAEGLSGKDLIKVFACYCFDATGVHAYDDVVALHFPFDCGVRGAVQGKVLSGIVAGMRAKEVEVTQAGEEVVLKAGRSRFVTGVLPASDFLFQPPAEDGKDDASFKVDQAFLDALGRAGVSMGRDPSHPWRLGVTVAGGDDGGLTLYSSDNKSATRVTVPGKGKAAGVVTILPPRFCELLGSIGKDDAALRIRLTGEWAVAEFQSGLKLFSRTISGADVKQYRLAFKQAKDEETMEVPDGLGRALERALVVLPYAKDTVPCTHFRVAGGKLVLETESTAGDVTDRVSLDHADCEGDFSPELVHRALPHAVAFKLLPDKGFVLFRGKNLVHLVTTITKADKAGAAEAGNGEADSDD